MLVDLALDQSSKSSSSLAIGFVYLQKAFDSVPRAKLLQVLLEQHSIDPSTVECTTQIYQNTAGYVPGPARPFQMTMGLKQGCPLSSLAFGQFFDRVVSHVARAIPPSQKGNA